MNLSVVATIPGGPLYKLDGVTYEVPSYFDVRITGVEGLDYVANVGVQMTGAGPKAARVELEQLRDERGRPTGPYVTTTALRHVTVDAWLEAAVVAASSVATHVVDDETGRSARLVGASDEERKAFRRAWRKGGRRQLSDDVLRRVAEVYRGAHRVGLPPTQAVADAFGITRANAGQWVYVARDRGFLRAAPGPRQPGEVPEEDDQ